MYVYVYVYCIFGFRVRVSTAEKYVYVIACLHMCDILICASESWPYRCAYTQGFSVKGLLLRVYVYEIWDVCVMR